MSIKFLAVPWVSSLTTASNISRAALNVLSEQILSSITVGLKVSIALRQSFDKEAIVVKPYTALEQFLIEFQGYFYSEGWAGFYGIDDIVERTRDWYKYWDFDYKDRKEAGELKADDTLWLNFGYWSDKHEMVLCLDKTNRYFGNVIDTRGHPFLHGNIYIDGFYDSFKIYGEDHEENYDYDKR